MMILLLRGKYVVNVVVVAVSVHSIISRPAETVIHNHHMFLHPALTFFRLIIEDELGIDDADGGEDETW